MGAVPNAEGMTPTDPQYVRCDFRETPIHEAELELVAERA